MFDAFDFMKQEQQQGGGSSSKICTILGENASFNGTLRFEGAVRIDGKFEGEIKTDGDVIIGKKGEVRAGITAGCVIIGGRVEGDVIASRRLELQSQSQLVGNVKTSNLVVGEGVLLQGNCSIEQMPVLTPQDLGMLDVKDKKMLDVKDKKLDFYKMVKPKKEVPVAEGVGD